MSARYYIFDMHPATEEELKRRWNGGLNGSLFRCHLCGHKFAVGDKWCLLYGGDRGVTDIYGREFGCSNAFICEECDGPDVLDRWQARVQSFYTLFWWAADTSREEVQHE